MGVSQGISASRGRVLAVEDHPVSRRLIGDQLEVLGFEVSLAASVSEALQKITQVQYQLVLTDICMDGLDGQALARMLRSKGFLKPIIAITGNVSMQSRQRCIDAGIDAVLVKPLTLLELDRTLSLMAFAPPLGTPGKAAVSPLDDREGLVPLGGALASILAECSLKSLAAIREACSARDGETFRHHLHKLKGAFAMQQQPQVVDACRRLERSSEQGSFDVRADAIASLVDVVMRALG